MSKYKVISSRGKVLILRELLENKVPINQLAEKHDIHPNDIYIWRKKLVVQSGIDKYSNAKPRIISDNGSQFISKDFAGYLKMLGLKHVRTSIMYPQSNGKIERFHRTISTECIRKKSMIDLNDARKQIANYVEFYNTKRLHSALNYLTPEDYVKGRKDDRLKERESKLIEAKKARYEAANVS
ncbi:MAG: integrase core domain-containing protein [Ignavibacteria bacterium]